MTRRQSAAAPAACCVGYTLTDGVTSHRLWVQRAGLTQDLARRLILSTTLHGQVPEPLRLAHLIARGIAWGQSCGRA